VRTPSRLSQATSRRRGSRRTLLPCSATRR
jgi:hypothetical protein